MALSSDTIQKLLPLFRPLMEEKRQRREYLVLAFGTDAPVLRNLDWDIPGDAFIIHMIRELVTFGEIKPGKPALCQLIDVIREYVGLDKKSNIDRLLNQIREEIQNNHDLNENNHDLIKEIESYLFAPNGYMHLKRIVLTESKALAKVMKEDFDICPWTLSSNHKAQCKQCIEELERKSERFIKIISTIVYYDRDEQYIDLLCQSFKLLAKRPCPFNTPIELEGQCIRLYPLALAIYAVFIIGVQEKRYMLLHKILNTQYHREEQLPQKIYFIDVLNELHAYSHLHFKNTFEGREYFAPIFKRINIILLPWISNLLVDMDRSFYTGEFILGLADIASKSSPSLGYNKRLYLPGLYLYTPQAISMVTDFLERDSQWLLDLYPSLEALLQTFDETASKLDPQGWGRVHGFCYGALRAFRQNNLT